MRAKFISFSKHSIMRFLERANQNLLSSNGITAQSDEKSVIELLVKVFREGEDDKSFFNDKVFLGKLYAKYGYNSIIRFICNHKYNVAFLSIEFDKRFLVITTLSKSMAKIKRKSFPNPSGNKSKVLNNTSDSSLLFSFDWKNYFENAKSESFQSIKPITVNLESSKFFTNKEAHQITFDKKQFIYKPLHNKIFIHVNKKTLLTHIYQTNSPNNQLKLDKGVSSCYPILNLSMKLIYQKGISFRDSIENVDYLNSLIIFESKGKNKSSIYIDLELKKLFLIFYHSSKYYLESAYNIDFL